MKTCDAQWCRLKGVVVGDVIKTTSYAINHRGFVQFFRVTAIGDWAILWRRVHRGEKSGRERMSAMRCVSHVFEKATVAEIAAQGGNNV